MIMHVDFMLAIILNHYEVIAKHMNIIMVRVAIKVYIPLTVIMKFGHRLPW